MYKIRSVSHNKLKFKIVEICEGSMVQENEIKISP